MRAIRWIRIVALEFLKQTSTATSSALLISAGSTRDPAPNKLLKGRHAEYGRSVEDLTGVFAIQKFIQLWGNSTCGAISVDWLPCV